MPSAAVQRGPNGAFVYRLEDDTAKQTNVTVGQQTERYAVITGGLTAPAKVLTSGFARLTDGAKVRVIPAAAPADGDEASFSQPAGGPPPAADGGERARAGGEGRRQRQGSGTP